jgi:hypothetical protein
MFLSDAASTDEERYLRFAGLAGLGMAIIMVVAYGLYFSLSSVDSPHSEAAAYLDDIAGKRDALSVTGWLLGLHALLIVPWAFGLYYRLREGNELGARIALVFGVLCTVFEIAYVAPVAIINTHILPDWTAATSEATRTALLSDFQVLQWFSDMFIAAFDVSIVVFQVVFGLAMLRVGARWWGTVGYVTLASATANLIGVFSLAEHSLFYVGAVGLVLGWLFVLGSSLLLLSTPRATEPVLAPA